MTGLFIRKIGKYGHICHGADCHCRRLTDNPAAGPQRPLGDAEEGKAVDSHTGACLTELNLLPVIGWTTRSP